MSLVVNAEYLPNAFRRPTRRSTAKEKYFEECLIWEGLNSCREEQCRSVSNLEEIRTFLQQHSGSMNNTGRITAGYQALRNAYYTAASEQQIIDIFKRTLDTDGYTIGGPHDTFNAFSERCPISTHVVAARPDHYEGEDSTDTMFYLRSLRTSGILDDPCYQTLRDHIQPSVNVNVPVMPNFFLEVKGPSGSLQCCIRQTFYDGILGGRAMRVVSDYAGLTGLPQHENNASTITASYVAGTLTLYAVTVLATADLQCCNDLQPRHINKPRYHISPLATYNLVGNCNEYVNGMTALNNARIWARQKRQDVLGALEERNRP